MISTTTSTTITTRNFQCLLDQLPGEQHLTRIVGVGDVAQVLTKKARILPGEDVEFL